MQKKTFSMYDNFTIKVEKGAVVPNPIFESEEFWQKKRDNANTKLDAMIEKLKLEEFNAKIERQNRKAESQVARAILATLRQNPQLLNNPTVVEQLKKNGLIRLIKRGY